MNARSKNLNSSIPSTPHPFLSDFSKFPREPFLVSETESERYEDLLVAVRQAIAQFSKIKFQRIALSLKNPFEFLSCMIAAEYLGKSVILLSSRLAKKDLKELLVTTKAQALVTRDHQTIEIPTVRPFEKKYFLIAMPPYVPGEIILTTSGSTGTPKGVSHDWSSLLAAVSVVENGQCARWLLTYDFASFAGLQVILHAMVNGASLLIPGADLGMSLLDLMPTHVSATPSYWRKLLLELQNPRELDSLQHITLGGETITQDLLDQLSKSFPAVPITQIYASTEMGACFYVRDKKAGIPLKALKSVRGVRARVKQGELYIRSSRAMHGYVGKQKKSGWFATGDMVRVLKGRVFFVGRKKDILNVGGFKVYPQEVEEVIYKVPGVLFVRVTGHASSLVGQIVKAEIEAKAGVDPKSLQTKILKYCQNNLARPKVPRVIDIRKFELTRTGKISRCS